VWFVVPARALDEWAQAVIGARDTLLEQVWVREGSFDPANKAAFPVQTHRKRIAMALDKKIRTPRGP
jgi:hypothetical protein